MQSKLSLHCTQAPFDAKALLFKALLRLAQWAPAQPLVQDTIATLTFQNGTICVAGISFVRQNALCLAPFYHSSKLWALATLAGVVRILSTDPSSSHGAKPY